MSISDGNVAAIKVLRGAPCGATWAAAERLIGLPAVDVTVRMGLEVQFFCSADPAGWDPLFGRSPVHFAGKMHQAALESALRRQATTDHSRSNC